MEHVLSNDAFDRVVLLSVIAALVASVAISAFTGQFNGLALTIQVLVAVVALAAGRYGRRGGSAAAIAGAIIYVLVQGLFSATAIDPSPSPLAMVWPIAAFGVVGIAGGQVLTLLKYDPTRFASLNALDEWSCVYNEHHFLALLRKALSRFESRKESCAVLIVRVSYRVTGDRRAARNRRIVRLIAQQIVSGVRLVDDCARLNDGSFAVLISNCEPEQGRKAADRLRHAIEKQLRVEAGVVEISHAALPDLDGAFRQLMAVLEEPA